MLPASSVNEKGCERRTWAVGFRLTGQATVHSEDASSPGTGDLSQEGTTQFEQLPLPFARSFLLDENTSSRQLQESLEAVDARVLTVRDLGLLGASDGSVSKAGNAKGGWIITRDSTLPLDAFKTGNEPSRVVFVSEESTRRTANPSELADALFESCDPTWAETLATSRIAIVDLRGEAPLSYSLPIPPDRLRELVDSFEARDRVDSLRLAERWGCSRPRARAIARALAAHGWLRIVMRSGVNVYYPGEEYIRMKRMLIR